MDVLTDISDEIELICHEHMWKISCDESIAEWNRKSKQNSTRSKKSKSYPWQKPRCGFLINEAYCEHKSHFTGIEKNQKHDVDACDRKVFCYHHKKFEYSEFGKQYTRMEKIILERIQNQEHFYLSSWNTEKFGIRPKLF